MTNEDELKLLGCDAYSTVDEVKSAFKKLALLHHPDHGGSTANFILLKKTYDHVVKTHVPNKRPQPYDPSSEVRIFRVLNDTTYFQTVRVPYCGVITDDLLISCIRGMTEFNVRLKHGTKLPHVIELTNVGRPLCMHIRQEIETIGNHFFHR